MNSSRALPNAALLLGAVATLTPLVGGSEASGAGDLMALGVLALWLFAGAGLGLIGALLAIIALRRGDAGRGRAIAGLVLSSLPLALLCAVIISARADQPEELPLKPPGAPAAASQPEGHHPAP